MGRCDIPEFYRNEYNEVHKVFIDLLIKLRDEFFIPNEELPKAYQIEE
jgi:hypothetical protein